MFKIYNTKVIVQSQPKNTGGWTLIELLIVLLMLSFFMMLVVPQVSLTAANAEKIVAQQLLLEALAAAQLRDQKTVVQACQGFYHQEIQRFHRIELGLTCRITPSQEIVIQGSSAVLQLQLSSIDGFISL